MCSACYNKSRLHEKPRYPENGRKYNYKHTYGLKYASYEKMFEAQKGLCALCTQAPLNGQHFSVDHNHKTGEVRGLLCNSCNIALGFFEDKLELLSKFMNYLISPPMREVLTEEDFTTDDFRKVDT